MSNPWQIQTIQYDNTSAEGNIDATGYGQISILLSKYVLKEKGKGLSSNDFTDNDVRKLDSIEVGAQVNKLETLSINGGEKLYPDLEKNINFFVPTKVSQVENDSGYARLINTSQIEGYSDSYVGKSKYAFQDVENPAIGKNANADAGGVALGMNTSTSEIYDVNINNELKHNVETEMWEGKITESETSDYAIKNLNDTDLTELDTVIANLAIEVQDRIDGDDTLTQMLNAETTARQNADTILRNDLTLETQNRTTADTTLQNNINTEVQNRTNADSTLQGNINAEIQNRTNADNALQSSINTEIQNRTNADNALQSSINTEIQNRTNADNALQSKINTEIQNRTDDTTALQNSITSNTNKISTIESKIPNQASSTNQLADKSFVNSTVQTNTANFRGNWDTWTQVPTEASGYPSDYTGNTTPTVNDYMVVQNASDYSLETLHGTWRFKYTSNWSTEGKNGWIPEYQVNEEPFTSEQLYAINSGITSDKVTAYDNHLSNTSNPHSVTKAQVGLGNVDNTKDCNKSVKNSTCFGGCTYAQACADIRSGLTTCTGTVTSVNVSVNGKSGTAVSSSGIVTLTDVGVKHTQLCSSFDRKILFASGDIATNCYCGVFFSDGTNGCPFTYNSNTGELKTPKVTIGNGCATESAGVIYAHGNKSTNAMIQFANNTNDANGNGYVIGGGGIGIIGAGESATTVWTGINGNASLYGTCAGNECLYITADQNIYFYSNVNGGYACRKTATFCGSTGYLHGNVCGNVCGQAYNALYINRTAIATGELPLALAGNCNSNVCGGICVSSACQAKFDVATGNLKTTKLSVGNDCATMQYNSTTQAIEFVFA